MYNNALSDENQKYILAHMRRGVKFENFCVFFVGQTGRYTAPLNLYLKLWI